MSASVLTSQSPALSPANLAARLTAVRELSGLDSEVVNELADFVSSAPDEVLFRTNPYRYAAHTGLSERRALDLFLYATHAGIFEFNWGVLCPGCAAFITSPGGLRTLQSRATCHICQSDLEVVIDDGVEVAFTVSPAVRRIRFHSADTIDARRDWATLYFTSSRIVHPAFHEFGEHLKVEFGHVQDAESREIDLALEPGNYLLTIPRHHASTIFTVSDEGTDTAIVFDIFDGRIIPENPVLATGRIRITLKNRVGGDVFYGITRDPNSLVALLPDDAFEYHPAQFFEMLPYVTGKDVATSQVFRELFRAESIPSELGLQFKSMTFLFSDLKGSTALYDRIGDVQAYQLVREHFKVLRDIVAELGGAVVKTMGDAVMASFASPLPALEAAILMNREIGKLGADEGFILKLGLHSGPCIAIESNERLDYFGQTVNIAARVQNLAGPGEIVITDAVYECPGAAEALRSAGLVAEAGRATLRGIGHETAFYRLS